MGAGFDLQAKFVCGLDCHDVVLGAPVRRSRDGRARMRMGSSIFFPTLGICFLYSLAEGSV
jgi:hypothetical protein